MPCSTIRSGTPLMFCRNRLASLASLDDICQSTNLERTPGRCSLLGYSAMLTVGSELEVVQLIQAQRAQERLVTTAKYRQPSSTTPCILLLGSHVRGKHALELKTPIVSKRHNDPDCRRWSLFEMRESTIPFCVTNLGTNQALVSWALAFRDPTDHFFDPALA